jgi:HSP20 family molecular chaperone IbpA
MERISEHATLFRFRAVLIEFRRRGNTFAGWRCGMSDPNKWMWSEAVDMLARAERMHRELFRPLRPGGTMPVWEPPVDVIETDGEVLVLVALPGVDPAQVEALIDGGDLMVAGIRVLPPELRTAVIHRLELPQGRFERRIRLPSGRYSAVRRTTSHGCVLITLEKSGVFSG